MEKAIIIFGFVYWIIKKIVFNKKWLSIIQLDILDVIVSVLLYLFTHKYIFEHYSNYIILSYIIYTLVLISNLIKLVYHVFKFRK